MACLKLYRSWPTYIQIKTIWSRDFRSQQLVLKYLFLLFCHFDFLFKNRKTVCRMAKLSSPVLCSHISKGLIQKRELLITRALTRDRPKQVSSSSSDIPDNISPYSFTVGEHHWVVMIHSWYPYSVHVVVLVITNSGFNSWQLSTSVPGRGSYTRIWPPTILACDLPSKKSIMLLYFTSWSSRNP